MYFIKIIGVNYFYCATLISQSKLQGKAKIEYISSEKNSKDAQLKSITTTVDMPYTEGDRLLYKCISGEYSTIVIDVPISSKTITSNFVSCTDVGNNSYSTVNIGNQVWMAENLKTTRFNDSTSIPQVKDNTSWQNSNTPGYCWYKNDSAAYHNTYGVLYNGYSAGSGKLAPLGWHVPSSFELRKLTVYLGYAGGKLKETGYLHWLSPNTGATNESGFTALPGSVRDEYGYFNSVIGSSGWWWSSTVNNNNTTDFLSLSFDDYIISSSRLKSTMGLSVRCVKDITIPLIETEAAINDTLLLCYSKCYEYFENICLFDAIYSNNTIAPDDSWIDIYNHTQTYDNEKVLMLWSKAYDIIYKINLIIKSSEIVISDPVTKNKIIAQAKAMRAYLYYNLMIWFSGIPLEVGISENITFRNSIEEILLQVNQDATEAMQSLPMSWSTPDKFRIPLTFAKALLARAYLYTKNYNEALTPTQQIINSSVYTLSADTNNFTSASTEIFWGFEKRNNTIFNNFFNKGSYVPVIRYTESYLIAAEALFNSGNTDSAINYINALNNRRGNPNLTSLTEDELFQQWITELVKEGSMFTTLKRFNKALSIVQNRPDKLLLPIPQIIMNSNPLMIQNPGY